MAINLNDLKGIDFAHIGDLPKIVKLLITAILCIAIIVAIFFFVNQPQLDTLNVAQQKEVDLKSDFEAKQTKAASLNAYRKQLAEMKITFGALLHRLPSKTEVPGLLEDISAAAVTSGLKIESFKPQPEKEFDFYAELPIEITAIGNYHKFAEFVSKLASLDRIVTVHDMLISQMGQTNDKTPAKTAAPTQEAVDSLSMKITVRTYRYKEESTTIPTKPGKKQPGKVKPKGAK